MKLRWKNEKKKQQIVIIDHHLKMCYECSMKAYVWLKEISYFRCPLTQYRCEQRNHIVAFPHPQSTSMVVQGNVFIVRQNDGTSSIYVFDHFTIRSFNYIIHQNNINDNYYVLKGNHNTKSSKGDNRIHEKKNN